MNLKEKEAAEKIEKILDEIYGDELVGFSIIGEKKAEKGFDDYIFDSRMTAARSQVSHLAGVLKELIEEREKERKKLADAEEKIHYQEKEYVYQKDQFDSAREALEICRDELEEAKESLKKTRGREVVIINKFSEIRKAIVALEETKGNKPNFVAAIMQIKSIVFPDR